MLIFWAVLGGFVLDAIFADPAWLPHPVVLMGRCILALEKRLRAALPTTPQGELLGGGIARPAGWRPNCTRRWGWPCKCFGAGRPLRPKALSRKA